MQATALRAWLLDRCERRELWFRKDLDEVVAEREQREGWGAERLAPLLAAADPPCLPGLLASEGHCQWLRAGTGRRPEPPGLSRSGSTRPGPPCTGAAATPHRAARTAAGAGSQRGHPSGTAAYAAGTASVRYHSQNARRRSGSPPGTPGWYAAACAAQYAASHAS